MDIDSFSSLLLELYKKAHTTPFHNFHGMVLEALRPRLRFDMAFWGTVTVINNKQHVHAWRQYKVPNYFAEMLNVRPEDAIIPQRAIAELGRTLRFGPDDMRVNVLTALLTNITNRENVIITAVRNERFHTIDVLGLGRHDRESPFTDDETYFKQRLMEHLESMITINFEAQIVNLRSTIQAEHGHAIVDVNGSIYAADSQFLQLIALEWPDWNGCQLPEQFGAGIRANLSLLSGKHVNVHLSRRDGLILAVLSRRSELDTLTSRERQIAEQFANGASHKEVARASNISPETVRTYLRTIYRKLGIDDKAKLANILDKSRSFGTDF